jgi:hypothetical protein
MVEAVNTSEASVKFYQTTRLNITEDSQLHLMNSPHCPFLHVQSARLESDHIQYWKPQHIMFVTVDFDQ